MIKCRILILDDDPYYQGAANSIIKSDDEFEAICPNCFEVVSGINDDLGAYLTKIIEDKKPDVILTDIMYGCSPKLMHAGLEVAKFVKEHYPNIPVIGMSSGGCSQSRIQSSGIFKLLHKMWISKELIPTIKECLKNVSLEGKG